MKKKLLTTITLLLTGIALVGCGSVYKQPSGSYKQVDFVEGCKFNIPESFSDKATAITRVSKEGKYDENTLYYYKNGEDQYMMFCMSSFVILAEKNTDFDFQSGDYKEAVSTAPVMGMWMDAIKKGDVKSGKGYNAGKVIVDSVAQVTLTDSLYGDFAGKFGYMSDGTDNWAIFCGCPGESLDEFSKDKKDVINNVVYSLQKYEKPEEVQYDVIVQGNSLSSNDMSLSENSISGNSVSGNSISGNDVPEKIIPKNSSIYDMLGIGEYGYTYVFTGDIGKYTEPIIKIEEHYENADQIVKDYVETNPEYKNATAPMGCHWEAVKYRECYEGCGKRPYINIKLCGIDGELLKYHGIPYTKRTYDDLSKVEDDGIIMTEAYCFYAVPNGCKEYVLECGDGSIKSPSIKAAYYHIKVE